LIRDLRQTLKSSEYRAQTCALTSSSQQRLPLPASTAINSIPSGFESPLTPCDVAFDPEKLHAHAAPQIPQVRIDLIVLNEFGEVLLELMRDSPARGFWRVPGRPLLKDESIHQAITRIALNELGVPRIELTKITLTGIFEDRRREHHHGGQQYYSHYVALAYRLTLKVNDVLQIPRNPTTSLCWMQPEKLAVSRDVYRNSRAYALHL
jgi:colanic acid biosynthesis protein WcaH